MTLGGGTGGSAVLRFLEARTATHVFGLPGSSSVPIFHEFPRSKLTFVPSVQENAAVATADGYARFAGPTAVLLYMMPGTATALSNLYNAHRDETPLVVIISQQSSHARWGQASVGEADIVDVVRPFTRFAREVADANQIIAMLETAYRAALGPPSGPAVVVIPENMLRAKLDPVGDFPGRTRARVAPADLGILADRVVSARRPLFVVGGQLRRFGGSEAVEAIAAEFEVPIMYEPFWNDRLGVSPGHRSVLGQLTERSPAAREADLVMAIGCRMFNEVHPRHDPWFPADAFVAHINADGSQLEPTFAADWSCAADPGETARQLRTLLAGAGLPAELRRMRRDRLRDLLQRGRRRRPGPYHAAAAAIAGSVPPGYLVDEAVLGSSALVAALGPDDGSRYVSTTGGSLGWAPGAASGIALATGEHVTCVLGDGAFFFGLQGFWAATSMGLPITFVVLDNSGFGSTRWFERQYAATLADCERSGPAFAGSDFGDVLRQGGRSVCSVARGLGVDAFEVTDAELASALAELDRSRPVLFRVPIEV
jgi:thiamine pyrophosphate-dependent acetolactate synthase large subunit-like protein